MAKTKINSNRKTQDWYRGNAFYGFRLKLPKGYAIEVTVAQHQSGKVTVRQSVSKTIGFFNLRKMKIQSVLRDPFDTKMMDKLNRFIKTEKEVR